MGTRRSGICKLTNREGVFVKAHLIPDAFTRIRSDGGPFVQFGAGGRPGKRFTSWYDDQLVIRKGEDVLERYDTWAITELRKQKLVWSGWSGASELPAPYEKIPGTSWGIRQIEPSNSHMLRLFFLSLLWRAAASIRWEVGEIQMPEDHLEQLREMLLAGNVEPLSFYPIQLTQFDNLGVVHNFAPIATEKAIPEFEGGPKGKIVPTFRFYLDGLMAHFTRQKLDDGETVALGPLLVGNERMLTIGTIPFQTSTQWRNMLLLDAEMRECWPNFRTS